MTMTETQTKKNPREILFELRAELRDRTADLSNPELLRSPAIAAAAQILARAQNELTLWLECKPFDLAFLESIHPTTKLPRFASMRLYEYKQAVGRPAHEGRGAFAREGIRPTTDGCQFLRSDLEELSRSRGDGRSPVFISMPPSQVPAAIERKADLLPGEKFVTWEAVWEKAPAIEVKDPILYTVTSFGAFVIGAWDMTKLESYIVAEFTT